MITWILHQWWKIYPSVNIRVYHKAIAYGDNLGCFNIFKANLVLKSYDACSSREQFFLIKQGSDPVTLFRLIGIDRKVQEFLVQYAAAKLNNTSVKEPT